MPFAIEAMSKAAGVAQDELFDMIKSGNLGAETIAKFGVEMQKMARQGGALEQALETNRKAQDRMNNSFKFFANQIFESGFGEGLTDLFQRIGDFLKANEGLATGLGSTAKVILTVLAGALEAITPLLGIMSALMGKLNQVTGGWASGLLVTAFAVKKVTGALGGLSGAFKILNGITKKWQLILLAVIASLGVLWKLGTKVYEFFSGKAAPSLMEFAGVSDLLNIRGSSASATVAPTSKPTTAVDDSSNIGSPRRYYMNVENMNIDNKGNRITSESVYQEAQPFAT